MNSKSKVLLTVMTIISVVIGFNLRVIYQVYSGDGEYRVRYYASLVKRLDAVNSKSDFAAAASVIKELRNALRSGIFSSDEIRAELPGVKLSDGWVRVYELRVDECHVEANLEKIRFLAEKQAHERRDWVEALDLSKEAIHLYKSISGSKLLKPRFQLDEMQLAQQVELVRTRNVVAASPKGTRR